MFSTPRSRTLAGIGVVFLIVGGWLALSPGNLPLACPDDTERVDPLEVALEHRGPLPQSEREKIRAQFGESICLPRAYERLEEAVERAEDQPIAIAELDRKAASLPGALAQKRAMMPLQSKVDGATGAWASYSKGPIQAQPNGYVSAYSNGKPAGLVSGFGYDAEHKRLFAAVSAGGVWMTEAQNGDVGTLGDKWTDIGSNLPIQATADAEWIPSGGGTLVVLTGDTNFDAHSTPGVGVVYSTDLGQTWTLATGLPATSIGAFKLAVDRSRPEIIYAATSAGLFRSVDAGRSFANVSLPTSALCKGQGQAGPCEFANWVTDVVVKTPGGVGGTTCGAAGCAVIAAVGWPSGARLQPDGTPQAPGNGLYRSDTGEVDTFAPVGVSTPADQVPYGFTQQDKIGRVRLDAATGDAQDHNFLYAIVDDASLERGGGAVLDATLITNEVTPPTIDCNLIPVDPTGDLHFVCQIAPGIPNAITHATKLNGVYVSPDFGDTWIQLADETEITYNPTTGSDLSPVGVALIGYGPGIQASYNLSIAVDPTQADPVAGSPTRIVFGVEELFSNRAPIPLTGLPVSPDDFHVIGRYFGGGTCLLLVNTNACPTRPEDATDSPSTHPDQHDEIFVPDGNGGVWLFAANDGGIYKQHSSDAITDPLNNTKWGVGINQDFNTLLVYGMSVAKDGVVYQGLQDNGSSRIEPDGTIHNVYDGDGIFTAVDPNNSDVAYYQTGGLAMHRTLDGGKTNTGVAPGAATAPAYGLSPFVMDPLDANHLVAVGRKVAETLDASTDLTWTTVFDLGFNDAAKLDYQARTRALAVRGDNVYVYWCRPCFTVNLTGSETTPPKKFERKGGIATNVGGDKPPKKGTPDGWHQASLNGLPNRTVFDIAIDENDPKTLYAAVGGYFYSSLTFPGEYLDTTPNLGTPGVYVSSDAGEHFTNITGNLPGIAIRSIVKRGKQLIVGTDIGVFISNDLNGTTWAPMGDLPNIEVTQLVIDPANSGRLFAATHGRGVWTYKFTGLEGGGGVTGPLTPGTGRDTQRFGGALPATLLILLSGAAWLRRRRT